MVSREWAAAAVMTVALAVVAVSLLGVAAPRHPVLPCSQGPCVFCVFPFLVSHSNTAETNSFSCLEPYGGFCSPGLWLTWGQAEGR